MESMKDGSASCIFIKNLHVFMCRLWNLNELLDFFCKLKCYLLISNKELWFHIQGNGPSCDQPDNRSFFYKQKGLWQCQPPHFWFPVFLFKNCFCNLHSIQKFVVRASVARGQGSGLSAQKMFCFCFARFALPSLRTICFLVTSPAGDQIFCHQKSLQSCHTWPFSFHTLIFPEIAASKIFKNQ